MRKEIFCMKQFVSGILTLFWAAGTVVMAQAPPPGIGTSYGSVAVPVFLPPAPPDQTDPVDYWAGSLGLDTVQQASVKTILADQQSATNALMTSLDQARTALTAAGKAKGTDSQIDQLSADLGAIFAQAVAVQAKAYARFYALLTPDQKQKFDKLTTPPSGASFSVFGAAGGPGGSGKEFGTTVKH
jgi:Spy/CpxP family protein refolding chaperone